MFSLIYIGAVLSSPKIEFDWDFFVAMTPIDALYTTLLVLVLVVFS